MIVVILAATSDEARGHARLAGLAARDVVIPGSSKGLEGLRLDNSDLVIELPSFRQHPRRSEIEDATLATILRQPAEHRPPWHRIVG